MRLVVYQLDDRWAADLGGATYVWPAGTTYDEACAVVVEAEERVKAEMLAAYRKIRMRTPAHWTTRLARMLAAALQPREVGTAAGTAMPVPPRG
jgi:hypothetical protein